MKPLLSNPYIVGNPIKSREMFFGREDDFHFVARKIGEGRSNQIVVLCGERRSGKTSILFQILAGRLGESFLPILVDMQMLAGVKGDTELFRAIAQNGYSALSGASIRDHADSDADRSPQRIMESFLAHVRERAPGKIVLFLIDEYELIEQKIRDGTLSESAVHYLAGVLEGAFPASFVFTGSTNLEDRNPAVWRSLLGKSVYRKISYLSSRDTVRLITEPLRGSVDYPDEVVETICRLTGGQPFYTQVICQNLVDLLIDEGRANPETADLERIVREIVANPLPQMIYTWNSFAPWNRIVISSLAGKLRRGDEWADTKGIVRYVRQSRIVAPFSRERANVLLEEAYHRELLEKNDHGAYRFRMDVFRRWIQREHSIWKVAKEADVGFRRALRTVVVPVSVGLGALTTLLLVWLLVVPAALPGLAAWGRGAGLLPGAPAEDGTRGGSRQLVTNIALKANRGPFTVVVDSAVPYFNTDPEVGSAQVIIPALAAGPHDFVATAMDGAQFELRGAMVTADSASFYIAFPAVEAATAGQGQPALHVPRQTVEPAAVARKNQATLSIDSSPRGATVTVGNDYKGVTPLEVLVPADYQLVWLLKEGYSPANISARFESGNVYRYEVILDEAYTWLVFDTQREGSAFLDGQLLADLPTAQRIRVTSGRHTIEVVDKERGTSRKLPLNLLAGDIYHVKEGAR